MKHATVLSLIIIALACGGGGTAQPGIPVPEETVAAPPVQGTVAASDGVSIAYTIRGNESPALVFIHGWMCNQSFWEAQVASHERNLHRRHHRPPRPRAVRNGPRRLDP